MIGKPQPTTIRELQQVVSPVGVGRLRDVD
jgi:hypothetical protein